ncbi:MAG: metallo-mystery pair system four-Cys motif protein, partial [Aquincola sp.]|nr:metallo-mystery pair system four-Cys motif protein [Aquincola sp.]
STVQVTPLSDLILGRAWGARPSQVFSRYAGGADALGSSSLAAARQAVVASLATLGMPAPTGDGLSGALADGDATALALQSFNGILYTHDVTLSEVAEAAAARSDLAARITADRSVAVQFAAVAGNTPLRCGTPLGPLGSTATPARLMDFRFYLSAARLLRADGAEVPVKLAADSAWQTTAANGDAVTLIDLEDGSAECAAEGTTGGNALLAGTVPAGRYVGLLVTLGVPHSMNHTDTATAPPPLDSFAMGWSWQAGRKFAKIEVTQPSAGAWSSDTFFVHLGATGCTGNAGLGTVQCSKLNRGLIRLEAFDPRTQKVAVDLEALLAGTNITINQGGAQGCMSAGTDRDCDGVFRALGIDWRADGSGSGLPIDGGRTQTVFKAVAK